MKKDIKKFLNFSNMLADEARLISLKYFKKKLKFKNKERSGFDPVTVADIKIQKKLNRLILKYFPNHSIIGEEETHSKNSLMRRTFNIDLHILWSHFKLSLIIL